jgi:hypothetical protein
MRRPAGLGQDVEHVAVRRVDQTAHVLDAVTVVPQFLQALQETLKAVRIAPDLPQLVFGGYQRAKIAEKLFHELLRGDRPAVLGPVGGGRSVADLPLLAVSELRDNLLARRRVVIATGARRLGRRASWWLWPGAGGRLGGQRLAVPLGIVEVFVDVPSRMIT